MALTATMPAQMRTTMNRPPPLLSAIAVSGMAMTMLTIASASSGPAVLAGGRGPVR